MPGGGGGRASEASLGSKALYIAFPLFLAYDKVLKLGKDEFHLQLVDIAGQVREGNFD